LSPSISRDRSSSHARVNHLLSLNTGRLRWPPVHSSSASSVKHVKRAPTLRSILLPADPSGDMYDLVRRCLCYEPSRRITAEEALKHHWLRGVKEELEAQRREERERDREKERVRERREREEEEKGDRDRGGVAERRESSDNAAAFSVKIDYAEEKRRDDRAARGDSERDRRKHAEAGGSSSSRTSSRHDARR
jgi:serine/threonine protein kinase